MNILKRLFGSSVKDQVEKRQFSASFWELEPLWVSDRAEFVERVHEIAYGIFSGLLSDGLGWRSKAGGMENAWRTRFVPLELCPIPLRS